MRSKVQDLGIVDVYGEVARNVPDELRGSELVLAGYNWYKNSYNTSDNSQRSISGRVFECLVMDALWLHGVKPIYHQAEFANVPNVLYDIILYHPTRPVILSCKVSLRERWKQSDLEGSALKQVYRAAHSILVTLSREGNSVQRHISASKVLGLDKCVVIETGSREFDSLLGKLRTMDFTEAEKILPITGRIMR